MCTQIDDSSPFGRFSTSGATHKPRVPREPRKRSIIVSFTAIVKPSDRASYASVILASLTLLL